MGLIAFAGLGALWVTQRPPEPSSPASTSRPGPDGGPPDGGAEDAVRPPPLVWIIEGRGLPEAGPLGACLRAALNRRSLVMGDPPRLTLATPGLRRPQLLALEQGDLVLSTPAESDARLVAAAHVAAAGCVRAGARGLRTPDGARRWSPEEWPELGPTGGAPLDAFVALRPAGGATETAGLAAFGRPELVARGEDEDTALALRTAAATLFVGVPDAPLPVKLPGRPGRLVAEAPWWPGGLPAGRWGLAGADDAPWRPAPARPRPEPSAQPQPTPRPARPRPARPPTQPQRPASRPPLFLPDYR